MKLHRMELPREVIVGEETLGLVGEICKKLGFSKSALVVTGPKTCKIAGEKVVNLLHKERIKVSHFIVSSTTMWNVKAVEQKIKELAPQVVLGVGGGTTIDVAKLSSARQGLPFISVPTAASHDGIASCLASLKGLKKPYSIVAQPPMAIIADTGIIIQAPHCFAASGCGDIIAKFTAVRDWELAHKAKREYYGEYAASLALMSAKLVMENANSIKPENEEGVRVLLEALISCGVAMSIAGSSRPCSGSEHLFCHALNIVAPKPAMHGEQCGVGTIMMAYLQGEDWKPIKDTLEKVGASTTAEKLGIEPRYVIQALVDARTIRPERYTILEEKRLDHNSAKQVAEATGVIS
jgi:glycerol-1-phosphate dehydrogenase [NAD(P)+]